MNATAMPDGRWPAIARLLQTGLLAALFGAVLGGCAGAPVAPRTIELAGVVVDGERVARADESGLVAVVRNGYRQDGRPGMALQPGDEVETGPSAYALIRYPSGSEVFMRPRTRGRVGSFVDMVGEIFAKVRGAFAVQTTFVKAGAEGTAFSVRGTPAGDYELVVFDGTVRLSSLAEAWPSLALGPGTMSSGRPQVPPRAMVAPPEALSRTRDWVERMERLLPAPRSSNGSSVGTAVAIAALIAVIAASSAHDDALPAPTGLALEQPYARGTYRPCRTLVFTWQPVAGAQDYVVRVEGASPARPDAWQAVDTLAVTAPPAGAGARLQAGWGYRWHVQARDAKGHAGRAGTGPPFDCSSDAIVR